jgi:hypothetical protein
MENNKIIEQVLSELLQKTIEKKVIWTLVNPNALRWINANTPQPTHVTLQKQLLPNQTNPSVPRENYVLTIQSPPNQPIQINTAVNQSSKDVLSNLFKEAMASSSDKTIEILQNLLKGL